MGVMLISVSEFNAPAGNVKVMAPSGVLRLPPAVPMLADVALPVGVPGCDTYKVGSLGGGTVVSGNSGSGNSVFLHENEIAIKKSSANVRALMRLFTD